MRVSVRLAPVLPVVLLVFAAMAVAAKLDRAPANGPDPATKRWAQWPHDVRCEDGLAFDPVAAFSGPSNAEWGGLRSERALRRLLASSDFSMVRRHGWRRLGETRRIVDFAAGPLFIETLPGSASELEWIELKKRDGRWELGSYQPHCVLRTVRDGIPATPWRLSEDQNLPGARRIRVDIEPGTCNVVRNLGLQKPEFREQNGRLLMTLWRRPKHRRGTADASNCPPQPRQIVVELSEKRGGRLLYDGGTYPPLPASPRVVSG